MYICAQASTLILPVFFCKMSLAIIEISCAFLVIIINIAATYDTIMAYCRSDITIFLHSCAAHTFKFITLYVFWKLFFFFVLIFPLNSTPHKTWWKNTFGLADSIPQLWLNFLCAVYKPSIVIMRRCIHHSHVEVIVMFSKTFSITSNFVTCGDGRCGFSEPDWQYIELSLLLLNRLLWLFCQSNGQQSQGTTWLIHFDTRRCIPSATECSHGQFTPEDSTPAEQPHHFDILGREKSFLSKICASFKTHTINIDPLPLHHRKVMGKAVYPRLMGSFASPLTPSFRRDKDPHGLRGRHRLRRFGRQMV